MSPVLISLAVLKANWDRRKADYLENFVPMVAECIRVSDDAVVVSPGVRSKLEQLFGLEVPLNVVDRLLVRARKRGYVIWSREGTYVPNRAALAELPFRKDQQEILAKHDALVTSLMEFQSSRYRAAWSREEAEAALLLYLEEHEVAIVRARVSGSRVPMPRGRTKGARYIVGAFVQRMQERDASELEYLESIAKGDMLAQAILMPGVAQVERSFRKTRIYFDTTFLVRALGYNGEAVRAPCAGLLELLYPAGADLCVFTHTVGEMRGILVALARIMARGEWAEAYGPSMQYFLAVGCTASDLEVYANRLEADLTALRVRVVEKPSYGPEEEYEHVIDEAGFGEALGKAIGYERLVTLQRDVDSISAIMRLRRGRGSGSYEDCGALFVTTNIALARLCEEYFADEDPRGAVSPCVTDGRLTTIVWLKRPMIRADLPRRRIIADCYAATQPDDDLWRAYLREIEKVKAAGRYTAEDVIMLRHSLEARTALMEVTVGGEEAVTQGTVEEVLALARQKMGAELERAAEDERKKRQVAEAESARLRREPELRRARVRARAERYAGRLARCCGWAIAVLLVGGMVWTAPWGMRTSSTGALRCILFLTQCGLLVAYFANLMWGTTVKGVLRRAEVALSGWLERRLLWLGEG